MSENFVDDEAESSVFGAGQAQRCGAGDVAGAQMCCDGAPERVAA